jgi:paraquat-inducible protein A
MAEVILCRCCDLAVRADEVEPGTSLRCPRCGSKVSERKPNSLHRTAAFSLAALVLYVPANIYPILRMDFYGAYSESTVWDGCVRLFEDGMWFIALIVFLASIVIPLFKLLGLFFLVTTASSTRWQRERTRIYKFIDIIGPWAMLDVFLLAVLVAIVHREMRAQPRRGQRRAHAPTSVRAPAPAAGVTGDGSSCATTACLSSHSSIHLGFKRMARRPPTRM